MFPRLPSGGLYLGKAATVIYRLGVRYIKEQLGERRRPLLEELYGTVTEEEAHAAGLSIVESTADIGRDRSPAALEG